MCKYLGFVILIIGLASCTKTLVDIPQSSEIVNGFSISWRQNVSDEKKQVVRDILNNMQFVKGGLFLMGATQEQNEYAMENEYPAHYVNLSDYYICKKEVSIEQLEILCDHEFDSYERKMGAPKYTWKEWKKVLDVIREISGIEFDLPTEAQWEYAARGGIKNCGNVYPGNNNVEVADWDTNELGLYDMTRGHSEWCKDVYGLYENNALEDDPYKTRGIGHVIRGGNVKALEEQRWISHTFLFFNYYDDVRLCRVSARSYADDSQVYLGCYITCRCVINKKIFE